jgi:predicted ATPase
MFLILILFKDYITIKIIEMTECGLESLYAKINLKKKPEVDSFIKLLDETAIEYNKNADTCAKMCNQVVHNISLLILDEIRNDDFINITFNVVEDLIKDRPLELISRFITNIYSNKDFKKNILEENESFFLGETYSSIENANETSIFQFKNCWKRLNEKTRQVIKTSMVKIVKISDKYIKCRLELEKINELRKSIFQTLHKSSSSNL